MQARRQLDARRVRRGAATATSTDVADAPVAAETLAALLRASPTARISGKIAKEVFDAMWTGDGAITAQRADAIIDRRGLRQISDAGAIEELVDDVIAAHPAIVAEFRAGKEKAFNALVGKVMAATKGKANPARSMRSCAASSPGKVATYGVESTAQSSHRSVREDCDEPVPPCTAPVGRPSVHHRWRSRNDARVSRRHRPAPFRGVRPVRSP